MSKFRIFETAEFSRGFNRLDAPDQKFIHAKLEKYVYPQLRREPYFGPNIKKLRNYEPETRRYKIGSFRVFYSVNDTEKIVNILTIDFRKDAYR